MAYCDYNFYRDAYFGDVIAEEDFPRLSERASDYIRAATQGISDQVDGWQMEAVQKCTCAIAEVLLDESIMTASAYSGEQAVSSESVGSWSKSYSAPGLSAAQVENIAERKRDALLLYLGNLPAFAPIFKVRSYRCIHRN